VKCSRCGFEVADAEGLIAHLEEHMTAKDGPAEGTEAVGGLREVLERNNRPVNQRADPKAFGIL